jgi:hypothetical protein
MGTQNVFSDVGAHLVYFVISVLNPLVHQSSQSQNEELEKDANSMDSRILGFGAVSLNKSFPTFRILLGPSETELNATPSPYKARITI